MTRMVEEERLQIGTLKALGYKRGQIMFKYLFYAWVATLVGGAAGLAFGFTVIPIVIWNAYGTMYTIPGSAVCSTLRWPCWAWARRSCAPAPPH